MVGGDFFSIDPVAAERFTDPTQALDALNGLDWAGNPILARSFEDSVTNSSSIGVCYYTNVSVEGLFMFARHVVYEYE